jgi:hypothetical protein
MLAWLIRRDLDANCASVSLPDTDPISGSLGGFGLSWMDYDDGPPIPQMKALASVGHLSAALQPMQIAGLGGIIWAG